MIETTMPRILMCAPRYFGIEYEINPWMHVGAGHDHATAQEQWSGLVARLLELGAAIEPIRPVEGLPDLVFTANAGLIYRDRAIVSRFRHPVRQGESGQNTRWFEARGFQTEHLPEGVFFEGAGDALFCGDALLAGYRIRSDAHGLQWLGRVLRVEVLPLELVDPRFYHLDTCFCPIEPGCALYYPDAFDDYGRSVLRSRVDDLIAVSEAEAVTFCCNAVVVGRSVVLNEGAPDLTTRLLERGFDVHAVPLGQFLKSGGSAKCLTLRLDGEEAAGWKRES